MDCIRHWRHLKAGCEVGIIVWSLHFQIGTGDARKSYLDRPYPQNGHIDRLISCASSICTSNRRAAQFILAVPYIHYFAFGYL